MKTANLPIGPKILSHPRICLLTGHSEAMLPLARLTVYSVMADYAVRWGHDVRVMNGDLNPGDYFPLLRLKELVALASSGNYDWVYVIGADVMITNLTIPLASLLDENFSLIIATDWHGWQADSFLLRCSVEGIEFISDVIAKWDYFKTKQFKEQDGMFELSQYHPNVCKVVPQRWLNSYDYAWYREWGVNTNLDFIGKSGQWEPGDFVIHWAGMGHEVRLEKANAMLPQIVR